MYHLNTSIPAPYEMNNSMNSSPQLPAMAKGGSAKHKKVLAHFNPKELQVMDHLQGHVERCPKTGLKSYSHLEELFKNPHIIGNVHKHNNANREHHAMGGNIDHLAAGGRNGDTEMALIGPNTQHLFHQIAGRSTTNPNTGHPEFWSLGGITGALGGAASTMAGGLKRLGTAAAPMARKIGTGFTDVVKAAAPHAQTAFNTFAPVALDVGLQAGTNALRNLNRPPEEQQSFMDAYNPQSTINQLPENMRGMGEIGSKMYNSYKEGQNPQQIAGHGLSGMGGQFDNPYGHAVSQFGGALGRGEDYRSAAGSGMNRFGQEVGGPYGGAIQAAGDAYGRGGGQNLRQSMNQRFQQLGGRRQMIDSMANVMGSYGTQGGMRGAAQREGRGYMQKALPSYYPQQQQEQEQESYYPDQYQGYRY